MYTDLLGRVRRGINKRILQNKNLTKWLQRSLASSMALKIIGFSTVLAATSIQVEPAVSNDKVWQSEIRLDVTKSLPVILPEKEVNINVVPRVEPQPKPVAKSRNVAARERVRTNVPASQVTMPYQELAQKAAAAYGVPWQVVEAVWQVETGKSWDTGRCSYAGACGPMQFMPGTWRAYGVDGDGDGDKQITSAVDAVYAGSRYLAANGAASGQVRNALLRYNHSSSYVNKVLKIAREIGFEG